MNTHDSVKNFGLSGMSLKMPNQMANWYADERCPVCDEFNGGYDDLEFFNGSYGCGIAVKCSCPECGSRWTLIYELDYAYVQYDGLAERRKDYMTEDIEMYWVKEIDGRKVIHYNGYLWHDDGTWHEEEGTGCGLGGRGSEVAYVDAIEGSIYDFVWKQFERVQQYGGPITDEEHEAYARGWCENATYLPMDEVTVDTPCGTYWC